MNCLVINWISSRYNLDVKTSQHRYLCNNKVLEMNANVNLNNNETNCFSFLQNITHMKTLVSVIDLDHVEAI